MNIQNGMIIDIEEENRTMSDEEYDEWMDYMDTLREEREGY